MPEAISRNIQSNSVSVIIPTLGGEPLAGTIDNLNKGTLAPSEILVCIPDEDAFRVNDLAVSNVRVIRTDCRGQVAQRAIGFTHVSNHMVLQLDDDILLNKDALQTLADALNEMGPGNAMSPAFFDSVTGRAIHEVSKGLSGWLYSLGHWVLCGAPWGANRMGVITAAGINYGVDSKLCGTKPFETQWLPGGCVLSFKEDLIEEKFFPYTGKAYCEDIIHSFLRTKRGIRHWIIPNAHCLVDAPEPVTNPPAILAQMKAREYFVRLSGRSVWRLALYETLSKVKRTLYNCMKG